MAEIEAINTTGIMPATNGKHEDPTLTLLAAGDHINGKLVMHGDGQILGSFQGEIECDGELMIGPQAQVNADIRTVRMTLAGMVRGNVTATGRLRLGSTGRLEGDAKVGSLVVQEGGVHLGAIRVHPEGVPSDEPAPLPEAAPAPMAAPAPVPAQPLNLGAPVDRVKRFWGEFF